MRVYIAGKIGTESERVFLEKIDALCEKLGFETFLPHRDVGIARSVEDASEIFKGDIVEGLDECELVVASLEGLHIGAGTSWELGYAYAKEMPTIGIKIDESVEEGFEYLSSILVASMNIVGSFEELERELRKFSPKY